MSAATFMQMSNIKMFRQRAAFSALASSTSSRCFNHLLNLKKRRAVERPFARVPQCFFQTESLNDRARRYSKSFAEYCKIFKDFSRVCALEKALLAIFRSRQ